MTRLSIIIPLATAETQHRQLLADLDHLDHLDHLDNSPLHAEIIQSSQPSRASSLNAGSKQATGQWLWFLHADSRVSQDNLRALENSLDQDQHGAALHYFDLGFNDSGPLLRANALGANLRSRLLFCPYGDQGLCISKALFLRLGGFPENRPYGEDLLFVWRAHQAAVPLQRIPSTLFTSARKYHQQGWLNVTLLHQWYWLRLSLPELFKLILERWRRS
jgi:GT2 family glycosyltransferase